MEVFCWVFFLPLPQTVIKVNVTLGGDLTIYCIWLRR